MDDGREGALRRVVGEMGRKEKIFELKDLIEKMILNKIVILKSQPKVALKSMKEINLDVKSVKKSMGVEGAKKIGFLKKVKL